MQLKEAQDKTGKQTWSFTLHVGDCVNVRQPASYPPFTYVSNDVGQTRIAQQQPATGSDAVGLVLKAVREHFRKVLEAGTCQEGYNVHTMWTC